LLLQLKRCGQKLDHRFRMSLHTLHGGLVDAGGMTLLLLDAHDLAFSFFGSWQ